MANNNIAQVLIGISLVLSGAVGGSITDYYTSETRTCVNGFWNITGNQYKFKCTINLEEKACYKLSSTKKTCYLLNETALSNLQPPVIINQTQPPIQEMCSYRPESYCCSPPPSRRCDKII